MLREQIAIKARVENLNGDLHQPSTIRYVSRSFSVRCFISLAYGKGLISVVTLSIVVPQAIGSFLCNRIGDSAGEFLVIYFGGFIDIQCSLIALISLFLSWVWGHVCLVVSDRSKFCLSLSVYLLFLSLFLPVREFCLHSHVYTWFLLEYPRIYMDFLHIVTYTLVVTFLWKILDCWVNFVSC